MAPLHQDLPAILQILFAALAEYGCPHALVSDTGSVFTAKDYLAILRDCEIEPLHIEQGKPWQNMIEAQFKVQRRLADDHFEQAHTLEAVQNQHAAFIETFTTPPTGRIAHAPMGIARPSRFSAGFGGVSSSPSVCESSLDAPSFCGPSSAMVASVCSVSTSMRNMGSHGSVSPSGFTKDSCASSIIRPSSPAIGVSMTASMGSYTT
jgi:hypothetical protein